MAVRQYIGARYVPIFDGAWDNTKAYEPLTVVEYQGNSYTSRQAVPTGIAITNEQYWVQTGNYNAQVEAYRQEVLTFDGRITNNTDTIYDTRAITLQNKDDIQTINDDIANFKNMEGFARASYEVFTDISAYAATQDANVWDYFKQIFNETKLNMNVHDAPENTGWIKTNAAGQNARTFIQSIASNQSLDYRHHVQYVILNFGFYDIIANQGGNYETEGRNIVNAVSNYYPNAIVIVNPVSNNLCFGYNRAMQLSFYQLNYGMVRSQVPIKIVPWYIAWNVNQLAINHYYDTEVTNPRLLNSGGTNSIGAMIKAALFGCENAYERETRSFLNNFLDNTCFTAANSEFVFNVESKTVALTSGKITAAKEFTAAENIIGKMTTPTFTVADDIILAICIQNHQDNPIRGYLVLKANNDIVFRLNGTTGVAAGAILRLLPAGNYNPSFQRIID